MTLPDIYLILGSNIAPEQNLQKAINLLKDACNVLAASSVYRSPPQGFAAQPDFLNMAVMLHTTLTPDELKTDVLSDIEQQLHRLRDPDNKNAPRTIDLDIALWGSRVFTYGQKLRCVPDPDILHFAHIAVPLAELAPNFVHPTAKETLEQIARRFEADAVTLTAIKISS